MKTKEANDLSDLIKNRIAILESIAQSAAVNYTKTDSPESKETFKQYTFAAEELTAFSNKVFHVISSIERMIPNQETKP